MQRKWVSKWYLLLSFSCDIRLILSVMFYVGLISIVLYSQSGLFLKKNWISYSMSHRDLRIEFGVGNLIVYWLEGIGLFKDF